MSDDQDVQADYRALVELATELYAMWQVEENDAVWASSSGTASVSSGSGHGDPTASASARDRKWRDRDRIAGRLRHHRRILEDTVDQLRPSLTGRECRTDTCEGDGLTPDGRCAQCQDWIRNNPGFDPAGQIDPKTGRTLPQDWNARRPRACACSTDCCPDGCLDLVTPGTGRMSDRCYQRQSRARRDDEERQDQDQQDRHPWNWHDAV